MSESGEHPEIPSIGVSVGLMQLYEGQRNEAKLRHGKGKNTFPNGDVYEGDYVNGKKHGNGIYRWNKEVGGALYKGNYSEGERNGVGLMVFPDGSKYHGAFVKGKRTGLGVLVYANGDYYKGEWLDDAKHGLGEYGYSNGSKVT